MARSIQESPFTEDPAEAVSSVGETGLIARIREWLGEVCPASPVGIGDDCAVLPVRGEEPFLLTTDTVSFGQHFDESVSAFDAGRKLVNRNLSDIAAMGGEPGPALFSLLCGPDLSTRWLGRFVGGMASSCRRYGVELVGGDISELQPGRFSAVLTETGTARYPVQRFGAAAGDAIYVTGRLGGSLLGHHYAFEPRLAEGAWLAASGLLSAMMDLTDGLAKDLRSLVMPGCVAELDLDSIPVSGDAALAAKASGNDPLEHAFCDGEDYELLFSLKQSADLHSFISEWRNTFPETPLTRIGAMRRSRDGEAGLVDSTSGEPVRWTHGFEHLGTSANDPR